MKKRISGLLAIMLALSMVLGSSLAVFADTEGSEESAGGAAAAAEEQNTEGASGAMQGSDAYSESNDVSGSGVAALGSNDGAAQENENGNPGETPAQYTLSFDSNGGSGSMDDVTVAAETDGTSVTYNLPECEFTAPEGKTFDGWQLGSEEENSTYKPGEEITVTGDMTIIAVWADEQHYKVIFTDGQGKILKSEDVVSGKAATAPSAPARKGYHFAGWDEAYDNVTSDLTVNAKWHQNHTYGAWTVTVKPTYLKTGTRVRRCSCGQTQTETVARLTAKSRWISEGGKLYYFGSNGRMVTGWQKMKPYKSKTVKWCYFADNGAYTKSISKNTKNKWVTAGGRKFYFTKKKKPAGAGFNTVKKKLYYMDKNGAVKFGTFKASDGNTYTAAKDGSISGLAYYKIKYKTFVLVDISDQTIWYYQNGKQKLKSDVVTGNKGRNDTPTGIFKVRSKQRNIYLVGSTWRSHVDYWMAFKGSAYGLHDASWRTSSQFSNHNTYKGNGSHGCVNLRPSFAGKLYSMVKKGTPVIIQK